MKGFKCKFHFDPSDLEIVSFVFTNVVEVTNYIKVLIEKRYIVMFVQISPGRGNIIIVLHANMIFKSTMMHHYIFFQSFLKKHL
jgi:hypothetical protein